MINKAKLLIILIPLGFIIRFLDHKITDEKFLLNNKVSDHYLFLGCLLAIVLGLIFIIIFLDKNSDLKK